MRHFITQRYIFFLVVVTSLILNSCEKSQEPVITKYEHYLFNELQFSATTQEITAKLEFAKILYPQSAPFATLVKTDVDVYKITYTTTLKGKNEAASGLVYMPKTPGNYPVLSFQNGTNTLHAEAPSEKPDTPMLFMLESAASMGYIVVIPDYIGFGASSKSAHPYLHAESTVQSILDLIRAVNEFSTLTKIVAKPTKDLYLAGYSQGGWATMQTQKTIESNFAEEFNLKASSCGAGPYLLDYMNEYIAHRTEYKMPYFFTFLLNSFHTYNLFDNPLSDLIEQPYAEEIPDLYDGQKSGTQINAKLTTKIADLLTPAYINFTDPKFNSVKSALVSNSVKVTDWRIETPTRMYHGANDELIPLSMSQITLQKLKTAGTLDSKIKLITIPGVDHTSGVVPFALETILWFTELKK